MSIFIIIAVSCIRYTYLNERFPSPTVIKADLGETMNNHDVTLTVKQSSLQKITDLNIEYTITVVNEEGEALSTEEMRVLLAEIVLENNSNEPIKIPLYSYVAESGAWSNGIDFDLFTTLNETGTSLMVLLEPGERKELILPFALYSVQFKSNGWDLLESRSFYMVLSTYPVKSIIQLR